MKITFLGHAAFKIKDSLGTVVIDPYNSKRMNKKFPKVEADILTLSHDHDDHNAADEVGGNPLVLMYPGEYEMHGIHVYGFDTYHDKKKGEERGKNTMFKFDFDGVTVLHCGDLGHTLTSETLDQVNGADILMIPVGGVYTIDADEARQIVEKLEPSIVIPMHYRDENMNPDIEKYAEMAPVKEFLDKVGASDVTPESSLNVKKADLEDDSTKFVVLQS